MTKKERIFKNIANSKELQKDMAKLKFFNDEEFYSNAIRYIKAIKQNRVCCVIPKVSSSGMSLEEIYFEWLNEFITVQRFAEYYEITTSQAEKLISISKEIVNQKPVIY